MATAAGIALLTAAAAGCGGNGSPTGPGGGSGGPGPVGATIIITPRGVSPTEATISVGQSITLRNDDTRPHTISSDPHPVHTQCPSMNIGTLGPGQSRTSNAFTTAQSCSYHDHDDPTNGAWQGTVRVQ